MNLNECKTTLETLIAEYNDALNAETVDKNSAERIASRMDEVSKEAKKIQRDLTVALLLKDADPIVAAAKQLTFTAPAARLVKDKGVVIRAEYEDRVYRLKPDALTQEIVKIAPTESRFPKSGVYTHGRAWIYRAEKLGFLMALQTLEELGASEEAITALKTTYRMTKEATLDDLKLSGTSQTQFVKALQGVVDLMMFIPDEKGENSVKVYGRDAKFFRECFARHGKGVGSLAVLQGKKVCDYIFEICHMILTGKSYSVEFKVSKESTPTTVVRTLPEQKKDAMKPAKVKKPAPVKVPKPEENTPATTETPDAAPVVA